MGTHWQRNGQQSSLVPRHVMQPLEHRQEKLYYARLPNKLACEIHLLVLTGSLCPSSRFLTHHSVVMCRVNGGKKWLTEFNVSIQQVKP